MIHLRRAKVAFVGSIALILTTTAYAAGSGGGGGFGGSSPTPRVELSPEEKAAKAYNSGIKARDKALSYEAKAQAATSDKARKKANARAQKSYKKAISKQTEVVRFDAKNYRALNELGFAYRKTGDYDKALSAYNVALDLKPDFHEAIEYRGEATLALGRFEETKTAYMRLFRENRGLADQLMAAIDTWIDAKGDALTGEEAAFVSWVADRKRLAEVASSLTFNNQRSW